MELYKPGEDTPALTVPFKVSYPTTTILLSSSGEKEQESQQPDVTQEEPQQPEAKEYHWVLVDTVNYDQKEELKAENERRAGTYEYDWSSAPGSYSYTWTYVGEGDTWYDPDLLHGETSTTQCTWTVPPSTIKGGETVTLSLKLEFGAQELSYYGDHASASADFDQWDVPPGGVTRDAIRFMDKDGKDGFNIDYGKNILSVSETVTAKAPAGREEGDKTALRTVFSGHKQGTCYIYEWQQVDGSALPLDTEGIKGIVDIP
ncbi:MAG: hypothetical protein GXX99_05600 [Clostridiales bacterium]|nr:hypothetical protein [Clostridiales bacterium]